MSTHAPVRDAGDQAGAAGQAGGSRPAEDVAAPGVVVGHNGGVTHDVTASAPDAPTGPHGWLRTTGENAWRLLGIAAVIVAVVYLISLVQIVFVAVYLALVLTAVLLPLGNFYDRVLPRGLAMFASLLTLLAVVGGLATYVVSTIASRFADLTDQLGTGLDSLATRLPVDIPTSDELLGEAGTWFDANSGAVIDQALAGANVAGAAATVVVLAMFLTIFFLTGGGQMWRWFVAQLPVRVQGSWEAGGDAGWRTFSGYTRGIAFVALADATMAGIFLTVMGNPLALPLTVVVFLAVFVPMIGPVAAIVISAVVTLATGDLTAAIVVAIGMTVIAQIDANVLQPLITGKQVNLHPVAMALAITCGTVLAGLLGAVIAVPFTAVLWAVYRRLQRPDTNDEIADDAAADAPVPPAGRPAVAQ